MRSALRLIAIGAMLLATNGCALTMDAAMIDMIEDATREPEPPAPKEKDKPPAPPEEPEDCC